MQNPETHDTRALVERLFTVYERGDSQQLFDHVAEEIHLTLTSAPLRRISQQARVPHSR